MARTKRQTFEFDLRPAVEFVGLDKAIACVVAVAVLLPAQRANADIMLRTIHGPKDCPAGLTIKSKATDGGMIQFDIYVDSDAIANNELYKGRARAHAVLKIATAQEQIASVVVHGSPEGKGGRRTWYQFSIAPSAAKTSELQLGVSLCEKDGRYGIEVITPGEALRRLGVEQ